MTTDGNEYHWLTPVVSNTRVHSYFSYRVLGYSEDFFNEFSKHPYTYDFAHGRMHDLSLMNVKTSG